MMKRVKRGRHPWELSEWLRRRKLRPVRLVEEKDKAVLVVVANGAPRPKQPTVPVVRQARMFDEGQEQVP